MVNKESIKSIISHLNNDALQIRDDTNNLLIKLNAFIDEYETQRLMGEIVREGLDDNLIEAIKAQIPGIVRTANVFDGIVHYSEALKSFVDMQNDTPDLAKAFFD